MCCRPGCRDRDRSQLPPGFLGSPDHIPGCSASEMTKSLTLMLTVISESNFPYFDGSIFHNFTIVCFALLRLRAGAGVMKQRKLQQLCEEILLGCCLAQVMAAADISPSYISPVPGNTCTIVLRPHPAIITPHGGCYMRISSCLTKPGWCLANHGVI